jgi:hypothetical protein
LVVGCAYAFVEKVLIVYNDSLLVINMQGVLGSIKLLPSKKSVIKILQDVSGIIRPTRYY